MNTGLLVIQLLNGLQLGVLLFLLAAGLTLVFGIMDFVNLAHGAVYMLGAYIAAKLTLALGSFILAVVLALPVVAVIGLVLERLVVRPSMPATISTTCLPLSGCCLLSTPWRR